MSLPSPTPSPAPAARSGGAPAPDLKTIALPGKKTCATACKIASCATDAGCTTGGPNLKSLSEFSEIFNAPDLDYPKMRAAVVDHIRKLDGMGITSEATGVPRFDTFNAALCASAESTRQIFLKDFRGVRDAIGEATGNVGIDNFVKSFQARITQLHALGAPLENTAVRLITAADVRLMNAGVQTCSSSAEMGKMFNEAALPNYKHFNENNRHDLTPVPALNAMFTGQFNSVEQELIRLKGILTGKPETKVNAPAPLADPSGMVDELSSLDDNSKAMLLRNAVELFKLTVNTARVAFPNIHALEINPGPIAEDPRAFAAAITPQLSGDKGAHLYAMIPDTDARKAFGQARLSILLAARIVHVMANAERLDLNAPEARKQFVASLPTLSVEASLTIKRVREFK